LTDPVLGPFSGSRLELLQARLLSEFQALVQALVLV
jgi:hypothetical protein